MEWWGVLWQWEDLCGPDGMQPWNETTKDLGLCFQELFFQVPLLSLIAIVSGYFVGYRKGWVIRNKSQERVIIFRSFVVLALVFIPIIQLYIYVTNTNYNLYPIVYLCSGVSCFCWVIHFGYILALKQRLGPSSRGPTSLLCLWVLSAILTVVYVRSCILTDSPSSFAIATLCCHVLYLFSLIPSNGSRPTYYSSCLVGSQHTHSEYTPLLGHHDEDILGTAMQGNSWFSQMTFGWVNPLLTKGLANQLNDVEELFDLPSDIRCDYVGAKLDKALVGNVDNFQRYEEVPHEPFISSAGYGSTGQSVPQSSTPVTPTYRVLVRPERRHNVTLLRALHSCFAYEFYSIGFLKLVSDMAGFAGPLLLNKMITFIQDPTIDKHLGYIYAAALVTAMLVAAIFNAHFNWRMAIVGLKIQGAMVYTILNKVLSCTSTELMKNFTVGEVTNFMSTDTDRIVNSCPSFHALWSIPLQLFITLYLLYQQVGLSFLAGVAFSVILIPINKLIANKIGSLSTEMMSHKDNRVNLMSDVLRGIRVIKMQVWEDHFIGKVDEARKSELSKLRGRKYLDAICVVLWASTPVMVAALTLGTHALRKQNLDAPTVFTTVALVNMLIGPLNAFPWVLNGLTEAWVSIKRVQKLLELPEKDPERYYDRLNTNKDEDKLLILQNASFSWAKAQPQKAPEPKTRKNKGSSKKMAKGNIQRHDSSSSNDTEDAPFCLSDINLRIGREEFIGITGHIGSGKTSLLHAIMGEMIKTGGSIQLVEGLDSFGYVSQKPWLVRGTIRDNIIFGLPYDETKYKTVVDVCGLAEEMVTLGSAVVGEEGSALSGGQRMRVSLARAVYADKRVYLLDDVLSCVDARVAQHILQRCFLSHLRRTTRILVSHDARHLARTHRTVVLARGRVQAQGPPEDVLAEVEEYLLNESETADERAAKEAATDNEEDNEDNISRHSTDHDEAMSEGTVDWWVILMYLRSVGGVLCLSILISLLLMQTSQNFTFLWLAFWVKSRPVNATGPPVDDNQTLLDHGFGAMDSIFHSIATVISSILSGMNTKNSTNNLKLPSKLTEDSVQWYSADDYYLEMYFVLAVVNVLFTVMRAFLFAYGGVKAAARIHRMLLRVVLKAKVQFFDSTPGGRIINRFSSDTYIVDDSLPFILNILLAQLFSLAGALAVSVYGLPWLAAVLPALAPAYYWTQRRYRAAARQLRRLQSVARSPVYTTLAYTLTGSTSIVSLGASRRWVSAGSEAATSWQRAALSAAAASAYLALRLQAAALILVAAAAALAALERSDAATVGLALSYALSMSSMLSGVMNAFTETEREMIAVERVGEYIRQVELERVEGDPPPYGWPSQGVISFEDVVLRYSGRSTSSPALNGVTFTTHPSEKIGVAGRTGAGKSSLVNAILRLSDLYSGRIVIDGVDIGKLHLHALRSRIGVIPQEPFIFSGSIRDNVDPLHVHSEAEVCRALERSGAGTLDTAASASGLSRGHAQLLCVARALLHRAKIVLIDEATANVDSETERTILDTVRGAFAGSTVIFVAHRVRGVLECSRALVLGSGKILEHDTPAALLEDPTSSLYKLVHAMDE